MARQGVDRAAIAEAAYALAEYTPWTLIGVVAAAVVVNVVCEAVAAVLICVPVGRALQKIKK